MYILCKKSVSVPRNLRMRNVISRLRKFSDCAEHIYRIVLGKCPWALTAQAPKIEGGQLHRGGTLNGSTIPAQAPTWQPVAKCALGLSTLNVACGCGVSSAEYSVHLVGVNRLSACREFCGVHSWQNGT